MPVGAALEWLEDPLPVWADDSRPAIPNSHEQRLVLFGHVELDAIGGRRVLERVLQEVDEDALDVGSVDLRRRQIRRRADTDTRSASAPTCSSALPTSVSAVQSSGRRRAGPASSRERSRRFSTSRSSRTTSLRIVSNEPFAIGLGENEHATGETLARRADRRER